MIKVENGKVTKTSLPKHGYIDGKFVSSMSRVTKDALNHNGWYKPIHDYPQYDTAYQKLSAPKYTYDKKTDTVTASYIVIDKPEALLKRRIDAIEARENRTREVLVEKAVATEEELKLQEDTREVK